MGAEDPNPCPQPVRSSPLSSALYSKRSVKQQLYCSSLRRLSLRGPVEDRRLYAVAWWEPLCLRRFLCRPGNCSGIRRRDQGGWDMPERGLQQPLPACLLHQQYSGKYKCLQVRSGHLVSTEYRRLDILQPWHHHRGHPPASSVRHPTCSPAEPCSIRRNSLDRQYQSTRLSR